MGKQWKQWETLCSWAPKSLQMVTAAMKLKDACSLEESYDQPRQHIKKQRHYFADKGLSSQSFGFSSSHVWMWELDCEGWVPKNWCFWTVILEKTLESPLNCKEIQPVTPKGNQSWIFIGITDAEAETPILWPPELRRPWCWERLRAGGEGDDRGWDGCMASPTQGMWAWVSSWSSPRLTSIESVMPCSHLILGHPLLLLPPIPLSIRVFSNESTLHMRWPKYWSFSFSIIPSKEISGLISFRMDWLGLLAV